MSGAAINVLLVDDSTLIRNLIARLFKDDPAVRIVGTAADGRAGLERAQQLDPDVVLLDLEMPVMDGIEFLKERQKRALDVPVVIFSSVAQRGARITMQALALGASDFILKPADDPQRSLPELRDQLRSYLIGYGSRQRARRRAGRQAHRSPAPLPDEQRQAPPRRPPRAQPRPDAADRSEPTASAAPSASASPASPWPPAAAVPRPEAVAIGISTGGPNALRDLLPRFSAAFPLPIFIVQHMPAGFTAEFAKALDLVCPLDVTEAADGEPVRPGHVYIAPGDCHLRVAHAGRAKAIALAADAPVESHRPSVNVLFESLAQTYGANRIIAVLMTGMGRDGAAAMRGIRAGGGTTVAQDEESSVVFGMARAAINDGSVQHVVPMLLIADAVAALAGASPPD